jgi:hypothetical protein
MMFSMDIEDFKSRLFLDVVSEEQKAALEGLGVPYQSKGSFVLVPRLLLDKDMSAVVTHEMLLDIGMDMDTLFEECKINSTKMYPGKVVGLSEYLSKEEMEIEPDGIAMPQVYVLTNATGANGAAAFFYQPDMVDNLATMLGKDLLVFPAGKNEMFCIPVSNSTQLGEIQEMYNEAVSSLGLDEEQPLSAEVMQYDHIKRNVKQMDGSSFSLDGLENSAVARHNSR